MRPSYNTTRPHNYCSLGSSIFGRYSRRAKTYRTLFSLQTTGCRESCRFYDSHSELIEATRTDTHFTQPLKYEVDDRHDVVQFSWAIPEGNDRIEPLVYVLTAYDQSFEEALDQTYFHNLTVSKDLLRLFSHVRLTAYDSNGKVAEMESSLHDFKLEQWSPSLNSLKFSQRSVEQEVDAYISWPRFTDEEITYEVEWKRVDNSFDITGHLTTQNNVAVVSLWPNALYQVKIQALRAESPNVIAQSDTIFFYTNPHPGNEVLEVKCSGSCMKSRLEQICLLLIVAISVLLFLIIFFWRKQKCSDSQCVMESVSVGPTKSPSTMKPNFVWHVGPLPGYKIFHNDDSFTWTPPELQNHAKSIQI